MTQLMLFDAPASISPATPVAASGKAQTSAAGMAAAENKRGLNRSSSPQPDKKERLSSERSDEKGGMHHMGDLARLVLMRYEMVHRRRAAAAQRQALCAG